MSNSDKPFVVREDQEDTGNFEVPERPIFKFQSECDHESVSNSSETHARAHKEKKKEEEEEEGSCKNRVESKEEKLKVEKEEDEEDGFRTPTSLDHRIPVAKQCPSAPKKPKPSLKRKADSHCLFRSCRRNPLDLSREVELLLFPTQHYPLSGSHQNKKKSRRQDCK